MAAPAISKICRILNSIAFGNKSLVPLVILTAGLKTHGKRCKPLGVSNSQRLYTPEMKLIFMAKDKGCPDKSKKPKKRKKCTKWRYSSPPEYDIKKKLKEIEEEKRKKMGLPKTCDD